MMKADVDLVLERRLGGNRLEVDDARRPAVDGEIRASVAGRPWRCRTSTPRSTAGSLFRPPAQVRSARAHRRQEAVEQRLLGRDPRIQPDHGGSERHRVLAQPRLVRGGVEADQEPVGEARPLIVRGSGRRRACWRTVRADRRGSGGCRVRRQGGQQGGRRDQRLLRAGDRGGQVDRVGLRVVVDDQARDLAAILRDQSPLVRRLRPGEPEGLQPGVLAFVPSFVGEDARLGSRSRRP